jgi:hypothetical protein
VTGRPVPWRGVFNYLEDLAEAKPSATDYAMKVRKLYDVLAEDTGDPVAVREFLLFRMSWHEHRGLISKQHCRLVAKLLPKPGPSGRGRGRTIGALGKAAYDKKYDLHRDWIYEKTVNPSLTKKQFAMQRLGITDEDLKGDYASDHYPKVEALLQEMKPARMKYLDEGQRRVLETIYPLQITYPQYLARKYQEAKQHSPKLSKEDFLQRFFGWPRRKKRHPVETAMIREYIEKLEQGEKILADSERG